MNKTELIDHIAASAEIPKVTATRALEAVLSAVTTTLKDSGSSADLGLPNMAAGADCLEPDIETQNQCAKRKPLKSVAVVFL